MTVALLLLALADRPADRPADAPPNVVLIFCDDLGYADIGPFGAPPASEGGYDTPNLDAMAGRGAKLTDFYVSSAVCTNSTRSSNSTACSAPPRRSSTCELSER